MRSIAAACFCALLALAAPASAQPSLHYGDVLVSTSTGAGPSRILVYTRDGALKGALASVPWTVFGETIYRDGVVYVATIVGIWEIDSGGALSKFSDIRAPAWLSPAADGRVIAANTSGELYVVNADGTLRLYRDTVTGFEPGAHGIELSSDHCTVFYLESAALVTWDACRNTKPSIIGPVSSPGTRTALRLLPDGTFLAAYRTGIARLDAGGYTTRTYAIPTHGLALDIDRSSFWAGAGSTLLRVDIDSGAVLVSTNLPSPGEAIVFLGVVGEPRAGIERTAEIPTLSTAFLVALAGVLAVGALIRMHR